MNNREDELAIIQNLSRENAVEWIMDEYGEELKRFIYTYVKSFSTTDDLFQEIMLILFQKLDTFQGQSTLKTWFYRITANKCKDYLKSPANRMLIWKDHLLEQKDHWTPERSVIEEEWKNQLINEIMRLPLKYREVLILQYYKELSIQEISELLEENASTIRTRIMRAKQKLKQKLGEVFMDETIQE